MPVIIKLIITRADDAAIEPLVVWIGEHFQITTDITNNKINVNAEPKMAPLFVGFVIIKDAENDKARNPTSTGDWRKFLHT